MELKQQIIAELENVQDEHFLEEFLAMIRFHIAGDRELVPMTPAMKARVKIAEEESRKGLGIPHEQVMEEMEQWLK